MSFIPRREELPQIVEPKECYMNYNTHNDYITEMYPPIVPSAPVYTPHSTTTCELCHQIIVSSRIENICKNGHVTTRQLV